MALFVLGFVALLASGWRYPCKPSTPAALGAGALSGFSGGAAQIGGPPLILYWLGSPNSRRPCAPTSGLFWCIATAHADGELLPGTGLSTAQSLALAVLLWPAYIRGAGCRRPLVPRRLGCRYRRIAYVIVALAALGQPAAVRQVCCTERAHAPHALIFCTSASDTSKLA